MRMHGLVREKYFAVSSRRGERERERERPRVRFHKISALYLQAPYRARASLSFLFPFSFFPSFFLFPAKLELRDARSKWNVWRICDNRRSCAARNAQNHSACDITVDSSRAAISSWECFSFRTCCSPENSACIALEYTGKKKRKKNCSKQWSSERMTLGETERSLTGKLSGSSF